ncbi:MAG: diguanylate cyclase [Ignavibacteria bacterium]|nr:diguanylate cyclase [Ignavibacteria bacterium]
MNVFLVLNHDIMTNGGIKALMRDLPKRLSSEAFIIVASSILVPVIGFFAFGMSVGLAVAVVTALGAFLYLSGKWRSIVDWVRYTPEDAIGTKEDVYHHPPEGSMKTLMFDDYQSSGGKYEIREVKQEDTVVPSTKSVFPAARALREQPQRKFQVSDFVDTEIDLSDVEPRSEFRHLLNKSLITLRDVTFAHTVAFFWVNTEKKQNILEAKATDSQNFSGESRFDLENDIVSQVARNGNPQFHGRITPVSEKDVIRYYDGAEFVKSVVAVPVFYPGEQHRATPVGVIVADSKAEDAFGPETLETLGHFTKLVSALIRSYTGKYDLLLDSELLTSLRRLQDRVRSEPGEYNVLNSLAEEANRLLNWDYLTIVMYAEEKQGWVIQKVVNKAGTGYVSPDQAVEFGDSIVGQVIKANRLEMVDDWSSARRTRFFKGEAIECEGSFACVPISSFNRCYGVLTLESKNRKNFSGKEVETIYRLVESAAGMLEVIYMNELVKEYVIVDQVTGSCNQRHFLKKLDQEVIRAADYDQELALVTLGIDERQQLCERHGIDGFDTILNQVARIIRGSIRSYDIVGRLEDDRLGILLVNTTASDGYLWAEKMRKQIAGHIITNAGKSFSVTISAGVCGLAEGMHREELLQGTSQVLHKAVEGGGNLVRVF